ncbi:MAG: T9SS type B sorting domain-containing protein [Maribacter sp.]|nr:T9SS type B sorting domain-containing protein [Maribacter sp.]
MSSPANNAINVSVDTSISWNAVSGAFGYFLLVGTTPGGRDLVDRINVGDTTAYKPPQGLPENTLIYVKVTIDFQNDFDMTCPTRKFTTGLACDHFVYPVDDFYKCDIDNDNIEEFNINLTTLNSKLIGNQTELTVTYHNAGGDLIDFSPGTQFVVNQRTIRARVTNIEGCYKETSFKLTLLSPPIASIIEDVIECESFTLPPIEGDSNYFTGIRGSGNQLRSGDKITSTQTIFIYAVRADCSDESSFDVTIDSFFCQEPEEEITFDFPFFFTPNGDGINEFWHFIIPEEKKRATLKTIDIFDRYGNLLARLGPESQGWDGNFKGRPQPSSDYWFQAISVNKKEIRGHFSLKR